ncbi:MAG: hypothetical protein QOI67_1741 [Gaiellaceae bacterium]|nr:hypothetical protein [Gaiellaceae bacterium]
MGVALLFGLALALPTSSSAWEGDFETGNVSQWAGVFEMQAGRVSVVQSPVRQGRYAARFEVRAGDHVNGWGGERALIYTTPDVAGIREGVEQWWSWSTYFVPGFRPVSDARWPRWNIFSEWHHTGSTGEANIMFTVATDSRERIMLSANGGDVARSFQWWTNTWFELAPLKTGKWYDFIFHVKWSESPAQGFVEAWVDGQHTVGRTPTATLYTGKRAYPVQGYYRGDGSSASGVVVQDGMRVSADATGAVAPFRLRFDRRPIAEGARVTVTARSFPGVAVGFVVRDRRGRLLGTRKTRTGDDGTVATTIVLARPASRGSRVVATAAVSSALPLAARRGAATLLVRR